MVNALLLQFQPYLVYQDTEVVVNETQRFNVTCDVKPSVSDRCNTFITAHFLSLTVWFLSLTNQSNIDPVNQMRKPLHLEWRR